MMKMCPKCKTTTVRDAAQFCFRDGAVLESVKVCECGNQLMPEIEKFCEVCGKEVVQAAEIKA